MELTNTNVRYLLTIYHLSQARLEVSSKDIAQTLDVSRASVTSMMSILTDKRLVTKERYGKVHLTDDGCRWARVLASQTDKLAETLQNRMELSYEEAWKAACAAVSELPRHCFEPIHVPDRQRKEVFQSGSGLRIRRSSALPAAWPPPWWEPRLPSPPRPVSSAWPAWPRA